MSTRGPALEERNIYLDLKSFRKLACSRSEGKLFGNTAPYTSSSSSPSFYLFIYLFILHQVGARQRNSLSVQSVSSEYLVG